MLKILILGGTTFLGPHLVHDLQENGHEVTLFNRGTQSNHFTNVEQLHGDRDGNLEALKGKNWDAIIDTSATLPRLVQDSSEFLAHSTKHYTFISSIGVYQDFHQPKINEDYPLAKLEDEKSEEITEKTYGGLKAACEKIILDYFPNSCLIIRPGLIIGPLDPTERFSYWPIRIEKGGDILAPAPSDQLLQYIDARDLAKWIVAMIEQKATGIYNATGPDAPITFEKVLRTCQHVSTKNSTFTWAAEDFLIEHHVQDWTELPLWLSSKRNMPGFLNVSIDKALQAGLVYRPLSETIQAILAWDKKRGSKSGKIGLNPDKEQTLLKLLKEEQRIL
ncbi:MAG: NAD-dependent epimerase/dehydratase family protein [Candidatus Protochlamydia sp.]|nr:NAD-dependent epimerase/dehydratase family protein [Candidatus Protochlamydia sp.]